PALGKEEQLHVKAEPIGPQGAEEILGDRTTETLESALGVGDPLEPQPGDHPVEDATGPDAMRARLHRHRRVLERSGSDDDVRSALQEWLQPLELPDGR